MLWPRRCPTRSRRAPTRLVLGGTWTDYTAAHRTSRDPFLVIRLVVIAVDVDVGLVCWTATYPGSPARRPWTRSVNRSISNFRSSISRHSEEIRAAYGAGSRFWSRSWSSRSLPLMPNRSLVST
jgi:hypothetical protein